jgi:hypothetical protein
MADDTARQRHALALDHVGIPYTEQDLDVLSLVAGALGPGLHALDTADLRDLPPEHDLDPGRPPR